MELTDRNIRDRFGGAGDFNARTLRSGGHTLYAYFIDGLVSGSDISDYIIKPISLYPGAAGIRSLYDAAMEGMVYNAVAVACTDAEDAARKLVNGFCIVLFPDAGAIAYEVKTGEKRSIAAPDMENTAKGPKDSFVETVRSNTSLIRRHLRSPDLRLYETQVGRRSLTNVSVVWLDGLTNPEFVSRLMRRLQQIDVDGFLTPAAVEEYVTGSRKTAFPLLQYTQRTDRFCKGILDGRVGLIVDGIPLGYLAPVDLGCLLDSAEDYSRDYISASAVRILRYGALLIDLLLPALYIAMTVWHADLLPEPIAQVILQGREGVPFSPVWEILMLLLAFELLQESGIHMPPSIGQSVSVIGGIVVGTVGVEAGLVSAVALIAVSLAGVCGFVIPNRDLANALRVWRFLLAAAAACAGLWGMAVGIILLLVHLFRLKSLGVPYIHLFEPGFLRRRLMNYKYRRKNFKPQNRRRQR